MNLNIPWSDNKMANEIFTVIMGGCPNDDVIEDFFAAYENWTNPVSALEKWVTDNNVTNYRIHLLKQDVENVCGFVEYLEEIRAVTDKEIVIHDDENSSYFGEIVDSLVDTPWIFEEWNYNCCEDLKYNEKYFYNGSDAFVYTLIEKIN